MDNLNVKMNKFYRNVRVARVILILSLITLLIVFYIEKKYGDNIFLSGIGFIIEAVLIASIADGVAIYALTKKIKIWKYSLNFTGLIQNKRENLINGVVEAFKTKFFPKEKLIDSLQKIKAIEEVKKIIESNIIEENSEIIGKSISKIIKKNKEKIADIIMTELSKYLKDINSIKIVEKVFLWSKNNRYADEIISEIFNWVYRYVNNPDFKKTLENKMKESEVNEKKSLWGALKYTFAKTTNILNYSELSEEIQSSILSMLNNIKSNNKGKEWQNIENEILNIIRNLSENEKFKTELEKMKIELIVNMLRPFLLKAISMISVWLEDGKIEKSEVEEMLKKYGLNIKIEFETINVIELLGSAIKKGLIEIAKNDRTVQENYEKLIEKLIENEYEELLIIIEEVLSKLSDDSIADKVNE